MRLYNWIIILSNNSTACCSNNKSHGEKNFEKLLNEENEWNDELSAEYIEGPADMISKEEVRQAIQDLKVRKAAGPSSVNC